MQWSWKQIQIPPITIKVTSSGRAVKKITTNGKKHHTLQILPRQLSWRYLQIPRNVIDDDKVAVELTKGRDHTWKLEFKLKI